MPAAGSSRVIDYMVRDQRYLLDSQGGFFDLKADPLQKNNLSSNTEPAEIAALQKVLGSRPADAEPPFKGYGNRVLGSQKKKRKATKNPK